MGELLLQLAEKLTDGQLVMAFIGFIGAVMGLLRALGELFLKIGGYGKLADKDDWFDNAGGKMKGFANAIGLFLSWLGVGNKK